MANPNCTYTLVLLAGLSFPVHVLADTVNVHVLQKGTGDPVVDATVVNVATETYETSNEDGNAQLNYSSLPIKIKVVAAGYAAVEFNADDASKPIEILLEPLSLDSTVLEISADRVRDKTSKVVLQAEELRKMPGTQGDPLKSIQALPGVVTAAEGTGVMYIRGSEPNQNLTFVNRARIGYLYHFGGLHSTISPQLVKDFNMFLGGFPVEYGNALGGALDVKLRAPRKDRLHQDYSFGTYESSAVIEGPLGSADGKDGFYISGRRSYIDFFLSPEAFTKFSSGDNPDDNNAFTQVPRFHDIQALWQHDYTKGRSLLQYFQASDELKLQLNTPSSSDPALVGELATSSGYKSLSWVTDYQASPRLYGVSSLYMLKSDNKLSLGKDETGQPFYMDIKETDYFWQPELQWQATNDLDITAGGYAVSAATPVKAKIARPPEFGETDYNLTELQKFTIDARYDSTVLAPYVKIKKTWFDKLSLQAGALHTVFMSSGRDTAQATSPRFSGEYAILDGTTLTAVWGRYVQMPDGAKWVREAGNPQLKFEESEHRIVGIRQRLMPLWSMQVEGYHKPLKNLAVTYDAPPPDNYKSEGTGNVYGFDVLVKRDYADGKMGWLSYSYLSSKRTEKGQTAAFDGDQRHTLSVVWSQPLLGEWRRWNAGFRLRANTGKPHTPVVGRTGVCKTGSAFAACADQANATSDPTFSHWRADRAAYNSARLPNFYQLDLRIDRQVLFDKWKMNVYLDVLNAFNIQNIVGYDYGNSFEKVANPRKVTSIPLFPSFGLEATF